MKDFAHICLDASLTKDGTLGVGIFNITDKEKIALTYNTKPSKNCFIGESMALICAMEYAYKKGFKKVHFFTDNKELGDSDINQRFLERFPFKSARISWIPRDLNKEADKMSKAGRNPDSSLWNKAANQTKQTNKIESTQEDNDIINMFKKYNYKQKVKFLKLMAKEPPEYEFIRMLECGEKEDYVFNYNKTTKMLIRMARTILEDSEMTDYVKLRFEKMKVLHLFKHKFEKEFKKRKEA